MQALEAQRAQHEAHVRTLNACVQQAEAHAQALTKDHAMMQAQVAQLVGIHTSCLLCLCVGRMVCCMCMLYTLLTR